MPPVSLATTGMPAASASTPAMLEHRALLYGSDTSFLDTVTPFLEDAIERSEAALAVTTSANIELLRDRLGAGASRVEFVEHAGWYRTPTSALNSYRAFLHAKVEEGAPWVRIVGEPVWAGRSDAEVRLWTRYESMLNLVFSAAPMSVLCPYDTRSLTPQIVNKASVTHPHIIGHDGVSSSSDYTEPGVFDLEAE